jgi:hypothetical protein
MPDFKTIANFRKDNSKGIRGVCRQFVVLCQQLGLFEENLIAIDGSKFKAVNNRDRNFKPGSEAASRDDSYQSSVEEQKTGPYVPIPTFFACSSIRPACSTSYLVGK